MLIISADKSMVMTKEKVFEEIESEREQLTTMAQRI